MTESLQTHSEWILTQSGKIRLLADGIIHVEITPGFTQTPETAQENLQVCNSFCQNTLRPVLLDLRGAKRLDPETREIYMDRALASYFLKLAIISNTDTMSRMMVNFYMAMTRIPFFPMKLFFKTEDAMLWLKK